LAIALADAVRDDRFARAVDAEKDVLVAQVSGISLLELALLLADVALQLVKLQTVHLNELHHIVM
jgi:hypothetical protein